jgi:nucleoside-diphosphate-sugar epimerase
MRNAIEACKRHGSALVVFDNVYAYGRVDGVMTEDTPYNPFSGKGDLRANVATMFMDEVKRGELRGMIVRSADVDGPGAVLSVTHATVPLPNFPFRVNVSAAAMMTSMCI